VLVEEGHPRQCVPRSLKEKQWHLDIREVVDAEFFRLACRMQRVGIEDYASGLVPLGHQQGRNSAAHRSPSQKEGFHLRSQEFRDSAMALDQLLGAIGASRASLRVGVVEGHHGVAGTGKAIAEQDDERVVLIYPCTMREEDSIWSITCQTSGHLSAGPCNGDWVDHEANVGQTGTVRGMELVIHETPDATATAVAQRVASEIQAAKDGFTLGLAGGSTPGATYEALRRHTVDWGRVDAWLSDERWVQPDHLRCNGRMAAETLMDHVDARFHRPGWSELIEPDDSAVLYESAIRAVLHNDRPDLILLGLGDDGHTASLFPGTAALDEESRWIVANHVPQVQETRLTSTYPMLWRARLLMVLVVGESKAAALEDSLAGNTPAGRLDEGEAKVEWHVDTAAASLLS
jgi:6-phosphogluconolactonase